MADYTIIDSAPTEANTVHAQITIVLARFRLRDRPLFPGLIFYYDNQIRIFIGRNGIFRLGSPEKGLLFVGGLIGGTSGSEIFEIHQLDNITFGRIIQELEETVDEVGPSLLQIEDGTFMQDCFDDLVASFGTHNPPENQNQMLGDLIWEILEINQTDQPILVRTYARHFGIEV